MRFDLETFQSTALTKKGIRSQSKQAKKKKKLQVYFHIIITHFQILLFFPSDIASLHSHMYILPKIQPTVTLQS